MLRILILKVEDSEILPASGTLVYFRDIAVLTAFIGHYRNRFTYALTYRQTLMVYASRLKNLVYLNLL